jgi:phosphomethylpyrimidine synthase
MRITEDVRTFAKEYGLESAEAIQAGMKAKASEFKEQGSEIYS